MRYPCRAPLSNHLLTVRGATLQILATSPVVRTSLTFVAFMAFSPLQTDYPGTLHKAVPHALGISSAWLLPLSGMRSFCRRERTTLSATILSNKTPSDRTDNRRTPSGELFELPCCTFAPANNSIPHSSDGCRRQQYKAP